MFAGVPDHRFCISSCGHRGFGDTVDRFGRQRQQIRLESRISMRPYCWLIGHRGSLACEEHLTVHGHRQIVVFNSDFLGGISRCDTCVVHEDIEAAEVRDSVLHCAVNLIQVGHIHLQWDGAAAQGLDFVGQPSIGLDVTQAQGHIRAGMGARAREMARPRPRPLP